VSAKQDKDGGPIGLRCAGSDLELDADVPASQAARKLEAGMNWSVGGYHSRNAGEPNLAIKRLSSKRMRAPFALEATHWNPGSEQESGSYLEDKPEHAPDCGESPGQSLRRSPQTAPVCPDKGSEPTSKGIGQKVAQARVPARHGELQEFNAERKRDSGKNDSPSWNPHEREAEGQGDEEKDVVDHIHPAILSTHQTPERRSFRSLALTGLGNEGGSQDDHQTSAGKQPSPASLHVNRGSGSAVGRRDERCFGHYASGVRRSARAMMGDPNQRVRPNMRPGTSIARLKRARLANRCTTIGTRN
jgi:hypothetical protein